MRLLTVTDDVAGQRIDNFLLHQLKGVPRSLVYRILRSGEVRVNKGRTRPDYRLVAGDVVRVPPLRLPEAPPPARPGAGVIRDLAARVLYEDGGLLVLDKPAGLAVHGGSGVSWGVIEALRVARPDLPFVELVHRLDRDTSGLLMIATRRSMLRALHDLLRQQGRVRKTYVALLAGRLKGSEHRVAAPLLKTESGAERIVRVARDGKEAVTDFRVIERIGDTTLVEASPLTGRTHQIRVHAQYLGHALLGDEKYGNDAQNQAFRQRHGLSRLFLHARDLELQLPGMTKKSAFHSPLAADLAAVLERMRHE